MKHETVTIRLEHPLPVETLKYDPRTRQVVRRQKVVEAVMEIDLVRVWEYVQTAAFNHRGRASAGNGLISLVVTGVLAEEAEIEAE